MVEQMRWRSRREDRSGVCRWLSPGYVALVICALACVPAGAALADETPGGEARKGAEVFQMYCAPCHGANGEGDGPLARGLAAPPRSFRVGDWMTSRGDAEMQRYIEGGGGVVHVQPLMPSWISVLGREDIAHVVAYIRQLQVEK